MVRKELTHVPSTPVSAPTCTFHLAVTLTNIATTIPNRQHCLLFLLSLDRPIETFYKSNRDARPLRSHTQRRSKNRVPRRPPRHAAQLAAVAADRRRRVRVAQRPALGQAAAAPATRASHGPLSRPAGRSLRLDARPLPPPRTVGWPSQLQPELLRCAVGAALSKVTTKQWVSGNEGRATSAQEGGRRAIQGKGGETRSLFKNL